MVWFLFDVVFESDSLVGIVASGWYSIGLLFNGGEWRWNLSGSLTNESFTNWAEGHPRDDMFCAYMDFDNAGRWISVYGHQFTQVLPLCEKFAPKTESTTNTVITTTTTTTTTTTDHVQNKNDTECNLPWLQILHNCYLKGRQAGSWEEGRSFCLDRGGFLIEVFCLDF